MFLPTGGILASPSSAALSTLMVGLATTSGIFTGLRETFSRGSYYTVDGMRVIYKISLLPGGCYDRAELIRILKNDVSGIPLDQIVQDQTLLMLENKNNKENCLALQSEGKYIDVDCNEPRSYVCYRAETEEESEVNECGTPDPGTD